MSFVGHVPDYLTDLLTPAANDPLWSFKHFLSLMFYYKCFFLMCIMNHLLNSISDHVIYVLQIHDVKHVQLHTV